jgi:hypothetical protein
MYIEYIRMIVPCLADGTRKYEVDLLCPKHPHLVARTRTVNQLNRVVLCSRLSLSLSCSVTPPTAHVVYLKSGMNQIAELQSGRGGR